MTAAVLVVFAVPGLFSACQDEAPGFRDLLCSREQRHLDRLQELVENDRRLLVWEEPATRMTPICVASWSGNTEAVRILLELGADIERADQDQTPLMWAAKMGHPELVKFLISREAKVDSVSKGGWTPLLWAVSSGQSAIVDELLLAGASIELGRVEYHGSILP